METDEAVLIAKNKLRFISAMTGKKFNRLTVVSWDPLVKSYVCRCDCGSITKARGDALKRGRHASCGCLAREKQVARQLKPDQISLKNEIYKNYKGAAKRRGYEFAISKPDFFQLIVLPCAYCGAEKTVTYNRGPYTITYSGIDRVDNSKGYTKENCAACCKFCNRAKGTMSVEEFFKAVRRVAGRIGQ